jgi:hypothetical protein
MELQPSPVEPQGILEGLNWRAVLLGAIVDIVLTMFASTILIFWVAAPDAFSPDEDVAKQAVDAALHAPEFLLFAFVTGIVATAIGAYVGARRAGVFHVRHGGWIAICSALCSLLFLLTPGATSGPNPPLWYDALGLILMLPAGLIGGRLAEARDRAAAA